MKDTKLNFEVDLKSRLAILAKDIDISGSMGYPPWSFLNWATADEHQQNPTIRFLVEVVLILWGIVLVVSLIMFFCGVAESQAVLLPWFPLMATHFAFCMKDRKKRIIRSLEACRWLTEDAELQRYLCTEQEGKESNNSLKVAIVSLEEYFSGDSEIPVAKLLSRVWWAIQHYPLQRSGVKELMLIDKRGSEELKRVAEELALNCKPWMMGSEVEDSGNKIKESMKLAEKMLIETHQKMHDRVKMVDRDFMASQKGRVFKFLAGWASGLALSLTTTTTSLKGFMFNLWLSGVLVMSLIIAAPVLILVLTTSLSVNFFGMIFAGFLFGSFLSRDIRAAMKKCSAEANDSSVNSDLLLLELYLRGLTQVRGVHALEVDGLDAMLTEASEHLDAGYIREIKMNAVTKKHRDADKARESKFNERCVVSPVSLEKATPAS